MRVFVTGASGYIGSAVVFELRQAGHQVLGLTRSDHGAAMLHKLGAQVLEGDLDDLDCLQCVAVSVNGGDVWFFRTDENVSHRLYSA